MRSRRSEQTITLFSFQDIITGVAGVMLFILLLLVVQLTLKTAVDAQTEESPPQESPEAVLTSAPQESTYEDVQRDLKELQKELASLRTQNRELMEATEKNLDLEIRKTQQQVDDLIQRANEAKAAAQSLVEQISAEQISAERKAILAEREVLRQELKRLEEERQRHASGKLVAFKSSSHQNREMWIVDLYDSRVNIFDAKAPETSSSTLKHDRDEIPTFVVSNIKEALQEKTTSRSVILILRPSVAGKGLDYLAAFRASGFQVALELLDEDTVVAASPPANSGGQQ